MAAPAFLNGGAAKLSVSFDIAGRPDLVNIQGAPAGVRLQLVDGVNPIGVVVVEHALEWGPGAGFGEPLCFAVPGQPANRFAVTGTYATGIEPTVVQSGDFCGDGFPHLIPDGVGNVALMRKKGGSFGTSTPLAAITEPTGIAVGDSHDDGNADLAVGGNKVTVLPGDGKRLLSAIHGSRGFQGGRQSGPRSHRCRACAGD